MGKDEMALTHLTLYLMAMSSSLCVLTSKLRDGWPFTLLSCILSYLPLIHSSQVNLIKSQLLLVTVITKSASD